MIRWLRPLYMDNDIKEKAAVIRYRFKFKKYPGGYFYIILPEGRDMPEIIQAVYLKQPYYKSADYTVIGVASCKSGALELFRRISEEAFAVTGGVNIRRFIETHKCRRTRG